MVISKTGNIGNMRYVAINYCTLLPVLDWFGFFSVCITVVMKIEFVMHHSYTNKTNEQTNKQTVNKRVGINTVNARYAC